MLFPTNFQIPSPEQANPVLYGMQMGNQNIAGTLRNQMLRQETAINPQMLEAKLQQSLLANAQQQIINQFLPQKSQSEIGLMQAQSNAQNALPGLYRSEAALNAAHGGLLNANTSLLRQQTPYMVAGSRLGVLTDPILRRLAELQAAPQMGLVNPASLSALGIHTPAGQPSASYAGNGTLPEGGAGAPMPQLGGGLPGSQAALNYSPMPQPMQPQAGGQPAPMQGAQGAPSPAVGPQPYVGDTSQNFALFGSPYNPFQLAGLKKGAETEAATNVTGFNTIQGEAAKDAAEGYDISKYSDQFLTNYNKTPAYERGWLGGLQPAYSTPTQLTDNAAQNLKLDMARLMQDGRMTNYELKNVGDAKPNRRMTPEAARTTAEFLKQKSLRLKEEPAFFNAARGAGVDWHTAQTLWQQYNNQRPVYDFTNNKANTAFRGGWHDYLTPQAVQAAQAGIPYVATPKLSNEADQRAWYATLSPQDKAMLQYHHVKQMGAAR